jgi:hypothetical protein
MPMFPFGSGVLVGVSLASGVQTPREFGTLQEVQLNFDPTTKPLYGSFQFPVDTARGTAKVGGTAKFATLRAGIVNDLFFTGVRTAGFNTLVPNEAHTPVTNTTTVSNVPVVTDLGVKNAATGFQLTKVASAPAAGQYSMVLATGVYTFAAADGNAPCLITYTYNTAGSGTNIVLSNQLLGVSPSFQIYLSEQRTQGGVNKSLLVVLNACTASKLALPTKLEDYLIQDFAFDCFADNAGNIGTVHLSDND